MVAFKLKEAINVVEMQEIVIVIVLFLHNNGLIRLNCVFYLICNFGLLF